MKAVLRGLRDYNVNSYTVTLKSNEKKYCVVTVSAKDYYTLQSELELMLIVDGMEIFTGVSTKSILITRITNTLLPLMNLLTSWQ